MEPVTTIAAFKNVWDLTKGLAKFSATTEFKDKIIELQGAIFMANERYSALLEENDKLKSKVAKLEAWDSEKKKYELKELHTGNFAYVLKKPEKKSSPPHYLCPKCYEDHKKSILQENDMGSNGTVLQCFDCKTYVISRKTAWRDKSTKPL